MISEPAAPIQTPAAPVDIPAAQKRWTLDQRYIAPLLITLILLVGQTTFGVLESLSHTLAAIATAIVVEIILSEYTRGKFPHLASAYISGISVGILVRPGGFYWPFIACAAISIASKYVLRWENRHLWNPSNFGICAMLFLAHGTTATLMQQWDNRIWAMAVIWTVGSVIIWRLRRFHICATYVISFFVFSYLRTFITGQGFWVEAGPITGPMYQLFIFFMITDPATTLRTKRGQIAVAFSVAVMEFSLRSLAHFAGSFTDPTIHELVMNLGIHAPYFALFTVGPIANAWEIWETKKRAEHSETTSQMAMA